MSKRKPDPKPEGPRPLTLKQRLFVEAYLGEARGNATEAARIAGYAEPNSQGPRLLVNVGIRAIVESRVERAAMGADEVLARLATIARSDMGEFLSFDPTAGGAGYRIDLAKGKGKTGILRKLKETLYGPAIEIHDPVRALKLLGEYHGLFRAKEQAGDRADEDVRTIREYLADEIERSAEGKPQDGR